VTEEEIRPRHQFAVGCRSCGRLLVWFNTPAGRRGIDEETTKPTDAAHQFDQVRHQLHRCAKWLRE
jgi:hypothetical protein